MALTYGNAQHREYLAMTDNLGRRWIHVFEGNTDFYSAAYWDLLCGLWRREEPVRKTEVLRMMTTVRSAHTAGKYVETALRHGLLVESDNPADARSKLIALSPAMRARLDAFFDAAIGEILRAGRNIEQKGTIPGD